MPNRNLHYYLIKTARVSGWILLPLMVLFIITGFSLRGEFGLSRVVALPTALAIHRVFEWPLVAVFVAHAAITIYFAMRRWGWIRTRTCTPMAPPQRAAKDLTSNAPPGGDS